MTAGTWMRAMVALVASALAGAASAADVVVWHSYRADERAGFEKVVAAYHARKGAAGPHVSLVAVPWDALPDKITAAVPRGKGPDIFIFPQDRLGGWIEAGNTVEPIDFFVDAATRQRFLPATVQALTYRGALYGLPTCFKAVVLMHNRKLLKTPPRTTAELAEVAKKLTDRSAGRYGLVYPYNDYYYEAILQNGFGGRVFDERLTPVLDSPENVRAAELLVRWKDEFLPPEPSSTLVTSLFNTGRAAMVFAGPWFLGEIAKEIDYGLATLPTVSEAGGAPLRPWMTVEGMYIAAPSKQKEAAYDFAAFATSAEGARIMALEGTQTPANQKVYADPAIAKDPRLSVFYQQARVAIPMPNVPEMTVMWPAATTAIGAIARKAASPQAALAKAQAAVLKDVQALHATSRR